MEAIQQTFKDVQDQAVDIVLEQFRQQNRLAAVEARWTDSQCGTADINSGLLVIRYSDLLEAVRRGVPLTELQDWSEYNSRLEGVGLGGHAMTLAQWTDYSTPRLAGVTIGKLEEVYAALCATRTQYEQMLGEAIHSLETTKPKKKTEK